MAQSRFLDHSLDRIFTPQTIALIGASERLFSVGRTILDNLLAASFMGEIYPINPNHSSILGKKCYPSIKDIPNQIDLAIIATPADTVPDIIAECVAAHVYGAIIISAGFKETGAHGIELEERILFHSRNRLRIIGPNCLGVMRSSIGLNATFARGMSLPGSIAFISQSGALCTAVLDWSLKERIGFSAFISIGSMIDVGWNELLDYFGRDPLTKSIMIYMESIGNARSFLSAARKVSCSKPILVLKAGRTSEAAQAAISHTGSLAGNDELFSAAMNRSHVLRIDSIAEMFSMAHLLAKQPLPKGPRLLIITNAGGPGVIATDCLIGTGGHLSQLSGCAMDKYDSLLSPHWSQNPIDLLGDASAKKFAKAVEIASKEKDSDGTLVILTPQSVTDATETARMLQPYAHSNHPIMACWMGEKSVEEGKELLRQYQIPDFAYPEMAVQSFVTLGKYANEKLSSDETASKQLYIGDIQKVEKIIKLALSQNRTVLDESESKKVIEAYGICAVRTEIARTLEEAVHYAREIGFPVVLKIHSHTITHKAKIGGVKLDLKDSQSVIDAFHQIKQSAGKHFEGVTVQTMVMNDHIEFLLGSLTDEQFGPAVLFGLGGKLVETIKERSIGLLPLTSGWARRLMKETKMYPAIGKNETLFEQTLLKFSNLIVNHPLIKECDINPFVVLNDCPIALDARIVLHSDNENIPEPVFG